MSTAVPEFRFALPGDELLERWAAFAGEGPGFLPAHWSPSQVKQFRVCNERYRWRNVQKVRVPPAKALVWGRADHAAQELNFVQKIDTGVDIDEDVLLDAFRFAVDVQIDEAGGPSEIDWGGDDAAKAKKEVVDDGTRLASLYHRQLAPSVQPTAVEAELHHVFADIPVPMKARLDVVMDEGVLDTKTTSSSKQRVTPENLLQGRMYTAATLLPTGFHLKVKPRAPGGQVKVLDHDEKTGEPFMVSLTPQAISTTLLAVRRTLAGIVQCMETYGPDLPWPDALAHEWACSYCGYRDHGYCPYWK